ncbi:MAG TPA: hypothetical protein VFR82_10795 [Nitrospira sp.]|nr:hypothetical protein [Nitrospira sp.]
MEKNEINKWRRWEMAVNVLLVAVALVTIANAAWGLQTPDVTAWAPKGTPPVGSSHVLIAARRDEMPANRTP